MTNGPSGSTQSIPWTLRARVSPLCLTPSLRSVPLGLPSPSPPLSCERIPAPHNSILSPNHTPIAPAHARCVLTIPVSMLIRGCTPEKGKDPRHVGGLVQTVREADGYQAHLVSPEYGLKRLVSDSLALLQDPVNVCVRRIHQLLLDAARHAPFCSYSFCLTPACTATLELLEKKTSKRILEVLDFLIIDALIAATPASLDTAICLAVRCASTPLSISCSQYLHLPSSGILPRIPFVATPVVLPPSSIVGPVVKGKTKRIWEALFTFSMSMPCRGNSRFS